MLMSRSKGSTLSTISTRQKENYHMQLIFLFSECNLRLFSYNKSV